MEMEAIYFLPNQNNPGVKNVAAKSLKKAMLKRCEIKMGS